MTEYWLQKKTIGGWSTVTWYSDLAQATENYNRCIGNPGYSWRLVTVEVVHEKRLEEEVEITPVPITEFNNNIQNTKWVSKADLIEQFPSQNKNSGWPATPSPGGWDSFTPDKPKPAILTLDEKHGGIGKVWMLRHDIKQRARVNPNEVDYYLSQGWIKGGPKTAFV